MYQNVLAFTGLIPRDKMNCLVRLGNCFLRLALMYQPSCLLPCCQGKTWNLPKKLLSKPQKHFILSLSRSLCRSITIHWHLTDIGDGSGAGGGGAGGGQVDEVEPDLAEVVAGAAEGGVNYMTSALGVEILPDFADNQHRARLKGGPQAA